MTNTAIIALLQEARVKIKGYASSDGLRLVEEAIAGLSEQPSDDESTPKNALESVLRYAGMYSYLVRKGFYDGEDETWQQMDANIDKVQNILL